MTMPPQKVRVRCPRCKTWYEDFYRPSINLTIEPLTKEEVEEMATVCCPNCGRKIWLASIIVADHGLWLWFGSQKHFRSRKRSRMLRRRVKVEWID